MKIDYPDTDISLVESRLLEVDWLLSSLNSTTGRPCPGCTIKCDKCGSNHCNCNCAVTCVNAPAQLSSEHARYPIEDNVLPLGFTLRSMKVCDPCWSCEGHLDGAQKLTKLPQVWFHCNSMTLIRLLDDCITYFKLRAIINNSWQIVVTYTEPGSLINAFSLKPEVQVGQSLELEVLQQDLMSMAQHLPEQLLSRALKCRDSLINQKQALQG